MVQVIIGGAGGIGAALARRLRSRSDMVHLIGRTESRLVALGQEIGASHTVADVTDGAALKDALAGIAATGLAYCVGSINLKPLTRLTEAEFIADFRLNAAGAALAVQAALPALKAKNGGPASVVFFSTVAVAQGFANHASVAMAKGAVEGLTRALAAELAPKVRVNCVAPSLTRTPLAAALTANDQMAAAIAALHPLQRLGEADDPAALAAFLLSDDASWITGQVIGCDGGRATLRTKG